METKKLSKLLSNEHTGYQYYFTPLLLGYKTLLYPAYSDKFSFKQPTAKQMKTISLNQDLEKKPRALTGSIITTTEISEACTNSRQDIVKYAPNTNSIVKSNLRFHTHNDVINGSTSDQIMEETNDFNKTVRIICFGDNSAYWSSLAATTLTFSPQLVSLCDEDRKLQRNCLNTLVNITTRIREMNRSEKHPHIYQHTWLHVSHQATHQTHRTN